MAIIKLGGVVVGVRGTIGGVTYSANKAGAYVKAWAKGANQKSPGQQVARGNLAATGPQWQALTGTQRSDWDTYAATDPEPHTNSLGEPVTFSGFLLFSMLNQRCLAVFDSPNTAVPTGSSAVRPTAVTGVTWDPDFSGGAMALDWGGSGSGIHVVVFAAVAPSLGALPSFERRLFLATWDGAAAPVNAFVSWGVAFPGVGAGWRSKLWLVQQRTNGLRSVVATVEGTLY